MKTLFRLDSGFNALNFATAFVPIIVVLTP